MKLFCFGEVPVQLLVLGNFNRLLASFVKLQIGFVDKRVNICIKYQKA